MSKRLAAALGVETRNVELDAIVVDDSLQPRVDLDAKVLEEYAARMVKRGKQVVDPEGKPWPPLVVFEDGDTLRLADGFHRYRAAIKRGKITHMQAEVRQGDRRAARLYTLSANATHGKRRTNKDKQRAIRIALMDPEWRRRTDSEIARMCAVSRPSVSTMRKRFEEQGAIPETPVRIGADGGEIEVAEVTKGRPAPVATPAVGPTIRRRDGTTESAGDVLPVRPVDVEVVDSGFSQGRKQPSQEFLVRDGQLEGVEPAPRARAVHYILDGARADYAPAARKVLMEGDVLVCLWPRVRELRPFGVMLDATGAEAWTDVEIEEMDCVVVSRHPVDGVRPAYDTMEAARARLEEDINGAR